MSRPVHTGIAHHSAGPEHATLDEIIRDHKARGFRTIGYHYLVHRLYKGGPWTVSIGRPEDEVGAHDAGQNTGTIGVCIAGDYTQGPVDPDGWAVLVGLVANISRRKSLEADDWQGHREHEPATTATECPGFDPCLLRAAVRSQLADAA